MGCFFSQPKTTKFAESTEKIRVSAYKRNSSANPSPLKVFPSIVLASNLYLHSLCIVSMRFIDTRTLLQWLLENRPVQTHLSVYCETLYWTNC